MSDLRISAWTNNVVHLKGRLTSDPKLEYSTQGTPICSMRIAVDSTKPDETDFLNVKCFKKTAEIVGENIKKGRAIEVWGRIKTTEWERRDGGGKQYGVEILARQVEALDWPDRKPENARHVTSRGYEERQAEVDGDVSF